MNVLLSSYAVGEEGIVETATVNSVARYAVAKEAFKNLSPDDEFWLRHFQTCEVCREEDDDELNDSYQSKYGSSVPFQSHLHCVKCFRLITWKGGCTPRSRRKRPRDPLPRNHASGSGTKRETHRAVLMCIVPFSQALITRHWLNVSSMESAERWSGCGVTMTFIVMKFRCFWVSYSNKTLLQSLLRGLRAPGLPMEDETRLSWRQKFPFVPQLSVPWISSYTRYTPLNIEVGDSRIARSRAVGAMQYRAFSKFLGGVHGSWCHPATSQVRELWSHGSIPLCKMYPLQPRRRSRGPYSVDSCRCLVVPLIYFPLPGGKQIRWKGCVLNFLSIGVRHFKIERKKESQYHFHTTIGTVYSAQWMKIGAPFWLPTCLRLVSPPCVLSFSDWAFVSAPGKHPLQIGFLQSHW